MQEGDPYKMWLLDVSEVGVLVVRFSGYFALQEYFCSFPSWSLASGNVKLSLCLISYALFHEDMWGSGGRAPPFLNSTLDGGEW
jgi:hypothetical protein